MKIFGTQRAKPDLSQVASYLSERNPAAADNSFRAKSGGRRQLHASNRFEHIARFSFIGREPSSPSTGVRALVVGTHLIFTESAAIGILRVIEGRMDVDEEFQP